MTSAALTVPTTKGAPPAEPLTTVIDALEAQLFTVKPTRRPKPVTRTGDLAPMVTADLAVWRHQVDDDHAGSALGVIADTLDDAHSLIVTARQQAPSPWQPLLTQCERYARIRRHLADAAELLDWAMTVARSVDLTMSLDVRQDVRRDEQGRPVPVSTATLTLRRSQA